MRMNGQSTRYITCLMFLVLIVLTLCFAFVNLLYVDNSSAKSNEPLLQIKDRLYCASFISDENYSPVRLVRIRRKYIQHWIRFLYIVCNIKIVQHTFTALLMSGLFILANKINKRISITALFMGGHDPPEIQAR